VTERYWEIDFLRGLAVIAMVFFHFLFDLNFFTKYSFDLYSGLFWGIGRFAGITFLLLVGLSLTISYNRRKQNEQKLFKRYLFRGARIFFFGLLITAATFIFVPQGTILFGILHLVGASIILAYPFLRKKWLNLFLGSFIFLFGLYLQGFSYDFPWLLWLGFPPANFYTFDYYPLLPWFGVVLIGIFLGNSFYPQGKRKFKFPEFSETNFFKQINFLGRNSLIIYLLHQPVLIAIVYFLLA